MQNLDVTRRPDSECVSLSFRSPSSEMEFDLDKALEDVPIHIEDPPLPPTPQPSDRMSSYWEDLPPPPASPNADLACVTELPPVEHVMLESQTKLRPKPKKRMKPSRQHVELQCCSRALKPWL